MKMIFAIMFFVLGMGFGVLLAVTFGEEPEAPQPILTDLNTATMSNKTWQTDSARPYEIIDIIDSAEQLYVRGLSFGGGATYQPMEACPYCGTWVPIPHDSLLRREGKVYDPWNYPQYDKPPYYLTSADVGRLVKGKWVETRETQLDLPDTLGHRWRRTWITPKGSKKTRVEDALTHIDTARLGHSLNY